MQTQRLALKFENGCGPRNAIEGEFDAGTQVFPKWTQLGLETRSKETWEILPCPVLAAK